MGQMALTKIPVKPHTLKRLKRMKKADMTYGASVLSIGRKTTYRSGHSGFGRGANRTAARSRYPPLARLHLVKKSASTVASFS